MKAEKHKETAAELSAQICAGLGGRKNISHIGCCATRLRCMVRDTSLIDDEILKNTGAFGVIHRENSVQIVYGPRVIVVKSDLEQYLECADGAFAGHGAAGETKKEPSVPAGRKRTASVIICSPVSGTAADLAETPDPAFAERLMGDGAMVIPAEKTVCAPADGTVGFIFETKHAFGFTTDTGVEMLLHIGIDTVDLGGEGFDLLVKEGEYVRKGTPLMRVDLDFLRENARSLASPVICTELTPVQEIRMLKTGAVRAGDPLFVVESYE